MLVEMTLEYFFWNMNIHIFFTFSFYIIQVNFCLGLCHHGDEENHNREEKIK